MSASRNTFAEVIDLLQHRRDFIWETCENFQLPADLAKREAKLAEYDAALALLRAAAEPEAKACPRCNGSRAITCSVGGSKGMSQVIACPDCEVRPCR